MTTTSRPSSAVKNELNTCGRVDIDVGTRWVKNRHRKKEMSEAKAKTNILDNH
jgi:hypothetical protein